MSSTIGTYIKLGDRVEIIGYRNGFAYITFLSGRRAGITTKVPASWVATTTPYNTEG